MPELGNTFSGPSKGLEIVGNKYAYAYTGNVPSDTTPTEVFAFATKNFYFVGKFQINMAIRGFTTVSSVAYAIIAFNGITIARLVAGFTGTDSHPSTTLSLVIPPHTEVTVDLYADADEPFRDATASIAGRVYGAE